MRKQPAYDLSLDLNASPAVADHPAPPKTAHEFRTGERDVLLDLVRIDGDTQARVDIDEPTVKKYAELYEENGPRALDAGTLFFDGVHYWLGNGFHRTHAARRVGLTALPFNVVPGTQRDAQLFALGPANRKNGLPFSNEDKHNAVTTMLADPEWATWTSRRIADHIGVSHTFVDQRRKKAEPAPPGNGCQEQAEQEEKRPRKALRRGQEVVMDTARSRRDEGKGQKGASKDRDAKPAKSTWPLSDVDTPAIDWHGRGSDWAKGLLKFKKSRLLTFTPDEVRYKVAFHFRDLLFAVWWGSVAAGGGGDGARGEALDKIVAGAMKHVSQRARR